MTVSTAKALKLTQVSSDLAGVVQLHSMSMQGNVMKMQAVSDLMVLPGSPLVLAPGGYHLMLMDLKPAFAQAKSVSLSLTFKDEAGKETILKVDAPIQMTPQHEPSSHEGGMEHMHMSH
jgi:copper(I)-binding protein